MSPKARQVIDLAGYAFLVPMLLWLTWGLWEYFTEAYRVDETSGESAWNPIIWPFKFSLVIGIVLLFMQTVVQIVRSLMILAAGNPPRRHRWRACHERGARPVDVPGAHADDLHGLPGGVPRCSRSPSSSARWRFNFAPQTVNVFAQKIDEVAAAYVLGAVPLFIFMGSLMERSGSRSGCSRRSICGRAACPAGLRWAPSSCA